MDKVIVLAKRRAWVELRKFFAAGGVIRCPLGNKKTPPRRLPGGVKVGTLKQPLRAPDGDRV